MAGFDITIEDINIKRVEKEGYAASTFEVEEKGDISLVLDVEITANLKSIVNNENFFNFNSFFIFWKKDFLKEIQLVGGNLGQRTILIFEFLNSLLK